MGSGVAGHALTPVTSDAHVYPRQIPAACTPPYNPTSRACPYFPSAAKQVTACASPVASKRVKTQVL